MSILIDTNILLRRAQPDHPSHTAALDSVARVLGAGETVYFTFQNISEFWNVATHPIEKNGLGFSIAVAIREVNRIERLLTFLPDSPAVYTEWKRLVVEHAIQGVKVHDAKLAAAMRVHGITRILTFNTDDFTRYHIDAIHPSSLLA
jgi:predicted nucleic acid-binding protein